MSDQYCTGIWRGTISVHPRLIMLLITIGKIIGRAGTTHLGNSSSLIDKPGSRNAASLALTGSDGVTSIVLIATYTTVRQGITGHVSAREDEIKR